MKISVNFELSRDQLLQAVQDWACKNINSEIIVSSLDGYTYSYLFKCTGSIGTDPESDNHNEDLT